MSRKHWPESWGADFAALLNFRNVRAIENDNTVILVGPDNAAFCDRAERHRTGYLASHVADPSRELRYGGAGRARCAVGAASRADRGKVG